MSGRFERVPLESREPLVAFAVIRVLLTGSGLIALAILGFPYGGETALVVGAIAMPWSLGVLFMTRQSPEAALSMFVAVGDAALLGIVLAVEPQTYGPVHFFALFMVAAHSHFQGEQRALLVGGMATVVVIAVTASVDVPIESGLLESYEAMFAVAALSVALVVGSLRSAESSGRLRARALSRRTIDTESEVRKHLAEAIHDGPIQELSSVELMLASAEQAYRKGDMEQGQHALTEARMLTRDNITFLRDEIVELGPHAFEERSIEQAIHDCIETWQRRHGFTVTAVIDSEGVSPEVAGALFRITQEAVTNAGKHAQASEVAIRLQAENGSVVLEVSDNGQGFGDVDPLGVAEPGHIGLASIRERAEMAGGRLAISDSGDGTLVRVSIPL